MHNYPGNPPFSIDQEFSRKIGLQLKAVREGKDISVEKVSNALVLSVNQVRGLEAADPSSFYSLRIFVTAIKKYAAYLDIPVCQDQLIINGTFTIGEIQDGHTKKSIKSTEAMGKFTPPLNNLVFDRNKNKEIKINSLKFATILVSALLLASLFYIENNDTLASLFKNTITEEVKIDNLETPIDPNPITAAKSNIDQVTINFDGNSWVRIEFINGKNIERIYTKNESETLNPEQIRKITIGNAPVTSIKINEQATDLAIFKEKIKGAVMKLTGDDLKSIRIGS